MCKLSLNQNLTLNYNNTSYSGTQDINHFLQAVAEKLYPKVINLRDLPSNKYVIGGSKPNNPTFQPLVLKTSMAGSCNATTTDMYDFGNMSTINWACTKSGATSYSNSRIGLKDENDQEIASWSIATTNSGTIDLSSYNGTYKVVIVMAADNLASISFNTLVVQ